MKTLIDIQVMSDRMKKLEKHTLHAQTQMTTVFACRGYRGRRER